MGLRLRVFEGKPVVYIDDIPCIIIREHATSALVDVINDRDFTVRRMYVAVVDGYVAHGYTLKEAFGAAVDKQQADMSVEERIEEFVKVYPKLTFKAKNRDLYTWHGRLTGSCTPGRDAFCKKNSINMDAETTIEEFISLTRSAFAESTLEALKNRYTTAR